jgi:hypothetical protein
MARYGFSPATRVFEAAGAGACIITDYWLGIDTFFEPGKEILVANNGNEVAHILTSLTQEKAAAIGKAALKKYWPNTLIPNVPLHWIRYWKMNLNTQMSWYEGRRSGYCDSWFVHYIFMG